MKRSILASIAAAAMAFTSVAAQAETVRPGIVSGVHAAPVSQIRGARTTDAQDSKLLGAPLFLIFLGAVAVTIGTIVVVNNGSNSPG